MDPRRPEAVAGAGRSRASAVRVTVAILVMLAGLLLAVGAWWMFVWLFAPAWFTRMLVVAAAAVPVVWLLLRGWSRTSVGWVVQAVALAASVVFYVWAAVHLVEGGLDAIATRETFATPASTAAESFAAAACAALLAAAIVAAVPVGRLRLPALALAAAVAVGALGAGGAALAAALDGGGCSDFRFDRERWQAALAEDDRFGEVSDAELLADTIVRCRTFSGATRAEVRRALGAVRHPRRRTWSYPVGITNDALGPGDGQELLVRFGRDGRARRASLLIAS